MRYLHTMIRVTDPDATIAFFELLGLKQVRRMDSEAGRFSLIFLAADEDSKGEGRRADAEVELRRWVREQAVSRTRHRHGRLLD